MKTKMTVSSAHEAFLLKDQVNDQGLKTGVDYTWRYTPAVNNWLGDETITPATVEFEFKDAKWTSYFQLKWAQ